MTREQFTAYIYYRRDRGFLAIRACAAMKAVLEYEHWQRLWTWELSLSEAERETIYVRMIEAANHLQDILHPEVAA